MRATASPPSSRCGRAALPQWRPAHDRRREVLVRALSRRFVEGAQGHGEEIVIVSPTKIASSSGALADFPRTTARCVGRRLGRAAKYIERVGDDGFKKAPVGAGPYKFVHFTPGVELVLDAFEGYWRKAPSIKRLVFRIMPDDTTRAAALKRGEVDVAFLLGGPVGEDIKRTPNLRMVAPLLGTSADSPSSGYNPRGDTIACAWPRASRSTVKR